MEVHDALSSKGKERQIWMRVNRIDKDVIASNSECADADPDCSGDASRKNCWGVRVRTDMNGEMVKTLLRALFHIHDHRLILRVRNADGNLIPVNGHIVENTIDTPHVLEVVRIHQHHEHKLINSDFNKRFRDLTKRKLDFNMRRLESLEKRLNDCENKQDDRIKAELNEIQKKLVFLHNRFDIVDNTSWKGMFKRNPFW